MHLNEEDIPAQADDFAAKSLTTFRHSQVMGNWNNNGQR
jgi:hypothetical protein